VLNDWQALVLGIVQGLTEPLPISSSGHLILVPWLFGFPDIAADSTFNKTFDVALHLGTLVGIVAYFRRDVVRILGAAWSSLRRRTLATVDDRLPWYIAIATIPGFVFGALGEKAIADKLSAEWLIGVQLIVFGLVLYAADRYGRRRKSLEALTGRDATLIGLAQALALMPGVSRSGITMTAALMLAFNRDAAARFSFLISIPVVAGAVAYKGFTTFVTGEGLPDGAVNPFIIGILSAMVSGFFAVWLLLRYIRTKSFTPFVAYRVLAGVFVIGIAASSFR
jgi:undecaprenyl-diphosphatase